MKTYTTRKGKTLTHCCHRSPDDCRCRPSVRYTTGRRPRKDADGRRGDALHRWAQRYLDSEGGIDQHNPDDR